MLKMMDNKHDIYDLMRGVEYLNYCLKLGTTKFQCYLLNIDRTYIVG